MQSLLNDHFDFTSSSPSYINSAGALSDNSSYLLTDTSFDDSTNTLYQIYRSSLSENFDSLDDSHNHHRHHHFYSYGHSPSHSIASAPALLSQERDQLVTSDSRSERLLLRDCYGCSIDELSAMSAILDSGSSDAGTSGQTTAYSSPQMMQNDFNTPSHDKPRCWDHGCNGREFSSKSNLTRHKKEKSNAAAKRTCPLCGALFTRNSARDIHLARLSCNRIRRYSNGRIRANLIALLQMEQNSQLPDL